MLHVLYFFHACVHMFLLCIALHDRASVCASHVYNCVRYVLVFQYRYAIVYYMATYMFKAWPSIHRCGMEWGAVAKLESGIRSQWSQSNEVPSI